jgi:hypothetical protein
LADADADADADVNGYGYEYHCAASAASSCACNDLRRISGDDRVDADEASSGDAILVPIPMPMPMPLPVPILLPFSGAEEFEREFVRDADIMMSAVRLARTRGAKAGVDLGRDVLLFSVSVSVTASATVHVRIDVVGDVDVDVDAANTTAGVDFAFSGDITTAVVTGDSACKRAVLGDVVALLLEVRDGC